MALISLDVEQDREKGKKRDKTYLCKDSTGNTINPYIYFIIFLYIPITKKRLQEVK